MSQHRAGPAFATLNNDGALSIQRSNFGYAIQRLFSALVATRQRVHQESSARREEDSIANEGVDLNSIKNIYSFCPSQPVEHSGTGSTKNCGSSRNTTDGVAQVLQVEAESSTTGSSTMSRETSEIPHSPFPTTTSRSEDDLFLFRRPLEVNLWNSESPESLPVAVETSMGSFAIVYNLALCYHLLALTTSDQTKVARAVELYNSAARLLDDTFPVEEEALFFAIVILNNAGHAHNSLQCFNRARQCFHQLAIAISTFLVQEDTVSPSAHQENPRRRLDEGFLLNVRRFGWTVPSLAPPAA